MKKSELSKKMNEALLDLRKKRIPSAITGGFKADLSPCHQVPTEFTKGGLRQKICSKCKKPIHETRFKE